MIRNLSQFAPESVEAGVGLALRDDAGRYLFFLAGEKHGCAPERLFYAGLGGHREPGEDWVDCAHREAREELGAKICLRSVTPAFHIPHDGPSHYLTLDADPHPLALYEMEHPAGTRRAGQIYRIVIYEASLLSPPREVPPEELQGVLALSAEQVVRGPERRPTLAELCAEGGALVTGRGNLDPQETRVFPIGTALALAHLFARMETESKPA